MKVDMRKALIPTLIIYATGLAYLVIYYESGNYVNPPFIRYFSEQCTNLVDIFKIFIPMSIIILVMNYLNGTLRSSSRSGEHG